MGYRIFALIGLVQLKYNGSIGGVYNIPYNLEELCHIVVKGAGTRLQNLVFAFA